MYELTTSIPKLKTILYSVYQKLIFLLKIEFTHEQALKIPGAKFTIPNTGYNA